jgi:hypothetical protein
MLQQPHHTPNANVAASGKAHTFLQQQQQQQQQQQSTWDIANE